LEAEILNGLAAIEVARLDNARKGLDELSKAIGIVEQMFAANPELFYQRILVVGYSFRGEILSSLGDQRAARENYAKALAVAEGLASNDAVDLESRLQIARVHAALGVLWAKSGGFADARRELASSLELAKQLLVSRPTDGEALDLAKTAQADLAVLTRCLNEGPCGSAKRFELPSLLN